MTLEERLYALARLRPDHAPALLAAAAAVAEIRAEHDDALGRLRKALAALDVPVTPPG